MRLRALFAPAVLLAGAASSVLLLARSPLQSCNVKPAPARRSEVDGDRSQGWLQQHRSEVVASNGMVTTQAVGC